MSARKIRNSWWVDFRFNHRRYRVKSPDNAKAGAEAYEAILRCKLSRGEKIREEEKQIVTFEDFLLDWLRVYAKPNNKASELRSKEVIGYRHLIPAFGKLALEDVQGGEIERYKAKKIAEGLHPKTINNHLTVLRRCLRSAQEWGNIERLPVIKLLKTPPPETHFLSEEEERVFLGAAQDGSVRLMFLTALHTGMRMGELIGLDWSAIDFERGTVCVRQSIVRGVFGTPKSNRVRFIPLTDTLARLLLERRKKSGLVFGREDGSPLSDSMLKKMIWKVCDDAGMGRLGWHRLRHTFASRLVSRGVHLRAVQQLLGHASIVMTERYVHLAHTVLTDAIRVLENAPIEQKWATGGQRAISFAFLEKDNRVKNIQKVPVK